MEILVDALSDPTGWSASGGAAVLPVNQNPIAIAGDGNSASLMFSFAAGSAGQSVQKPVSPAIDVSAYTELDISLYLVRKNGAMFEAESDYLLEVEFGDGKAYKVPTWQSFTHVTIPIALFGTISISFIKFTYLGTDLDYLVISNLVAVKPELPIDLLAGVKSGIAAQVSELYGNGILIGTVSGNAGDSQFTTSVNPSWLSRYAVVKIDDGTNSETHQIYETVGGNVAKLNDMYDGHLLVNSYTNANLYLQVPVEINKLQRENPLPGVVIFTMEPTPVILDSDYDQLQLCWGPTGPAIITEGRIEDWRVVVYSSALQVEPLAAATAAIRRWLSKHVVWIGGARCEFIWREAPSYEEPTDVVDLTPAVMYIIEIQVKEDVWTIPTPPVAAVNQSINPVAESVNLP